MVSIVISIERQSLQLLDEAGQCIKVYSISSAAKGAGEQKGSEQTPRGHHYIRAKIGANQPLNTVFVGRRPTGERYNPRLGVQYPQRDWILTRILWLCGREIGKNRLGNVDTMSRYVYIHGIPDEADMTLPRSKGCINMRNVDIVDLFERVPIGTSVKIEA